MGSIFSTQMVAFHASMHLQPGYAAQLAATIKAGVTIPVFAAGRIMTAVQAQRILAEGQADGVEMIRALIADPDLPRLSQQGQADQVRPCISCNQGCQVRTVMNVPLGCAVNPDVVPGPSLSATPARARPGRGKQSPQIFIIGGGPAGKETARTPALRGRRVVLHQPPDALRGAVGLHASGRGG